MNQFIKDSFLRILKTSQNKQIQPKKIFNASHTAIVLHIENWSTLGSN